MFISQHDPDRKPFIAAYLHANPSVRLLSQLARHSLVNPTTGTWFRMPNSHLSLALKLATGVMNNLEES